MLIYVEEMKDFMAHLTESASTIINIPKLGDKIATSYFTKSRDNRQGVQARRMKLLSRSAANIHLQEQTKINASYDERPPASDLYVRFHEKKDVVISKAGLSRRNEVDKLMQKHLSIRNEELIDLKLLLNSGSSDGGIENDVIVTPCISASYITLADSPQWLINFGNLLVLQTGIGQFNSKAISKIYIKVIHKDLLEELLIESDVKDLEMPNKDGNAFAEAVNDGGNKLPILGKLLSIYNIDINI
jgi:hypothetical protein